MNKILERQVARRTLLAISLAAALAWLSRGAFKAVQAQRAVPLITAEPVAQVPADPDDPLWSRVAADLVEMNPQDRVIPRVTEAGAKRIDVRALYDSARLAFLIEWKDAHKNVDLGTVTQYRDAIALQFPEDPAAGPTSIMMGQRGRGVVVYHWKSDWQFARTYDVDEAYPNMYADVYQLSGVPVGKIPEATSYLADGHKEYLTAAAAGNVLSDPIAQEKIGPVQKMRAEGFGSIEPHHVQDGGGMGKWDAGAWRVVISLPRQQAKFAFQEGSVVPLAFAVWDGSRGERNGQKAFSEWQDMSVGLPLSAVVPAPEGEALAAPPGRNVWTPLAGGLGGALAVGLALMIGLRMRRRGKVD